MKEIIYTNGAPEPIGPYSQAYKVGDFLFCSGQISINPQTGDFVDGDIKEQTLQCIKNIDALLKAVGFDFSNVVKTTCFLADMSDFGAFNDVYAQYFISKPARSCVAVKTLPKNALVEIEIVASM